jgi:hypothetical protein
MNSINQPIQAKSPSIHELSEATLSDIRGGSSWFGLAIYPLRRNLPVFFFGRKSTSVKA